MKITKAKLKQIIKEEFEATVKEGETRDYDWKVDAEISDALVNAILDMQEMHGDAYAVEVLRTMADDIEKEMAAKEPAPAL
tara:strand:- start:122 stop:364 length:243 start_codon:yes stop_codon:yes gene_type:complete